MLFRVLGLCLIACSLTNGSQAAPNDMATVQCRDMGVLVLTTWHQLSICVRHRVVTPEAVADAQAKFIQTYPKFRNEIRHAGPASKQAKQAAQSSPYDFGHPSNKELLSSICQSSNSFLLDVSTQPAWKAELACWR